MTERAAGFALLAVLLALLVLTGVLNGALALGRYHALASRAEARAARARVAAQSGVRLVAAGVSTAPTPVGGGEPAARRRVVFGADVAVDVSVLRLGAEWLWIEGAARVGSGAGQGIHRTGAVYWTLDARVRAEAVSATVEVGGGSYPASPSSITLLEAGADDPGYDVGACEGSALADPFLGMPAAPSRSPLGPDGDPASGAVPTLGLLGRDLLAARARDPSSAGGTTVLRVVDGPFIVPEEGLRGILVVGGDLEVPGSRELRGLALVGGSVTVRDGGRVVGALRVRGSVTVLGTGTILGSRCAILRALQDLPTLSRPLPAPGGTWVRIP